MTEPRLSLPTDDRNPYAAPATARVAHYRAPALETRLADRSTRLGAFLINVVLTVLAAIPGGILVFVLLASAGEPQEEFDWIVFVLVAYSGVILLWIFQAYLLVRDGQSIGKKLLYIKIVRYDNGERAGFLRIVLVREFLYLVMWFIPFLSLVYPLTDATFIFGSERRCLHDYLAGTKVIKVAFPRRRYSRPAVAPAAALAASARAPDAPGEVQSDAASHG